MGFASLIWWGWGSPDLILLIESHLHNLHFYVKFSLQFARDCVSKGFIWWVGLSFLFGGGEGFFYSSCWEHGLEEKERERGFMLHLY